ncbi:RNA polymerase sigma factor [Patescibacteria group bacterium]|nr:RNA polymerase sigma factor [Patescibacteria group bacterium]
MIQDIMRKANRQAKMTEILKDASDEEVLHASRQDPDAFGVLVERYEEAFLRKARSILRTHEDAEEVVQDTFTRIYLYADRYQPQEGAVFTSWAYAILIRLAFTRYQKMKKQRGRTYDLEPEAYERLPDESEFLEDLTIRDEVLMAFSKIPETASRILRLQFIEGKSQEEIAAVEGTSVSAVKTRVHRAKKLFKKAFVQNIAYDDTK